MTLRRRVNQFYTKVWTIRVACELSFQRRVYFSEDFKHSRNSEKNTAPTGSGESRCYPIKFLIFIRSAIASQ